MNSLPEELIEAQLERILASPEFVARDKLCRFLRYVVEQNQKDRSGEIKQYTIAVDALGYGEQFDPSANPSIRILAQRLRRALEQYYSANGAADPVRIEIPKGSYVPVFAPNPNSTQTPAFAPEFIEPDSTGSQVELPDGPSMAVLAFEYLGNETDNAYLASGITEEIVIALTRFPEYLVIGPLDRDIIRQKHPDPRDIGREYRVRFLLDGTVRMRGQSLRISVKLTDTISGQQLWAKAQDYDFAKATIDELEDDIVGRVVAEIADNFGVISRVLAKEALSDHNDNLSDYSAILKFHHHNRTLTEETMTDAILALENLVQRQPDHDLAIALLADFIGGAYFMGYVDDKSGLERAETLARKSLALNPNSQQAHYTMAQLHYQRFETTPCLAAIERTLELNPNNANYLAISALYLMGLGQLERGRTLINKAMRLNPHHPGWYHLIPFLYHYYRGEYETALVEANQFNTPEYFWDPLIRTAVLGCLGHRPAAEKAGRELQALVPDFENRGRSLIKRMVYQDKHVNMIWDSLQKAGIESQVSLV